MRCHHDGCFAHEAAGEPAGHMASGAASTSASTSESQALAKDLKRRGWRFVGPTTVYAFMQAMGLVNDHLDGCVAKARADAARTAFARP